MALAGRESRVVGGGVWQAKATVARDSISISGTNHCKINDPKYKGKQPHSVPSGYGAFSSYVQRIYILRIKVRDGQVVRAGQRAPGATSVPRAQVGKMRRLN